MIKSAAIVLCIVLLISIKVEVQTILIDPIGTINVNQSSENLLSSFSFVPTLKSFTGVYRVNLN